MLLAPVVYFQLMAPATGRRDYLATAAGSAMQIRVAVLLAFVLGALSLAIAIVAMPVFRRHSEGMTLTFVAISIVGVATLTAENVAVLNMVSLSQEYAKASAPSEVLQLVGRMARSAWYWAHFTNLAVAHAAGVVLTAVLYRFALVPRALAAFALAAGLVGLAAVTMPLLGYRLVLPMLAVTGLGHLALTLWLLAKGFDERRHLPGGEAKRELARA